MTPTSHVLAVYPPILQATSANHSSCSSAMSQRSTSSPGQRKKRLHRGHLQRSLANGMQMECRKTCGPPNSSLHRLDWFVAVWLQWKSWQVVPESYLPLERQFAKSLFFPLRPLRPLTLEHPASPEEGARKIVRDWQITSHLAPDGRPWQPWNFGSICFLVSEAPIRGSAHVATARSR